MQDAEHHHVHTIIINKIHEMRRLCNRTGFSNELEFELRVASLLIAIWRQVDGSMPRIDGTSVSAPVSQPVNHWRT